MKRFTVDNFGISIYTFTPEPYWKVSPYFFHCIQSNRVHLIIFLGRWAPHMTSKQSFLFCPVFPPLLLFPFTVPCRMVFAEPEDHEPWPNHLSWCFLTMVSSSSFSPMATWIFQRTASLVTWSLYKMLNIIWHITSQKLPFCSSAVKGPWFSGIQKYGNDKDAHHVYIWPNKYVVISTDRLQLCKSCCGLCSSWEDLRFWAFIWDNSFKVF